MTDSKEDFSVCFDKVLNFLSYRARSEYEISYYMLRKVWPTEIQQQIIEKLKHLGLINDEDFARQWISAKSNSKPEGLTLLKFQLKKKGISKEIIEKLLLEQRDGSTEEILAKKVATKRLEKLKNLEPKEKKEKLYGFLTRKGFASGLALRIIDKLLKKE